ncbi:MAG: sulfatase-like hydrolase/transferase [Pseudomonadota bacterium]
MKIDDKSSLLNSLVVLTMVIVFMQLAMVTTNMLICGGAGNFFYNPLLHDIFTSHLVLLPLLAWLLSQVFIYTAFITIIWLIAVMCGELFKLKKVTVHALGLLLWCLAVIGVLFANNLIYPHSFFTSFTDKHLFNLDYTQYLRVLDTIAIIFAVGVVILTVQLIKTILQGKMQLRHKLLAGFFVALLALQIDSRYHPAPAQWQSATRDKPNIIIIGLDGVRTDFVNQNVSTPNINEFLNNSADFNNAYTLIAQTLPSWVSILTGAGPKANLARENLVDMTRVYTDDVLPKRLQKLGYETVFATDDSRFNNITKNFGFDYTVTPRTGVVEFILGEFNDFPLSNLLVRTAIGKMLFPYNYANHESLVTYDPKNFMELMQQRLNHPEQKPLFLAVHFNVSGWPFGWYNSVEKNEGIWYYRYTESIRQADQQLGNFLEILQQHNLLKNTLVVLMSDHGVTLGLPRDRAISEKLYQGDKTKLASMDKTNYLAITGFPTQKTLATSYGYGGDILSPQQLHVLLAFKSYGLDFPVKHSDALSSLVDIAPTLLDFLHQPPLAKQEGKSLLSVVNGEVTGFDGRDLYFETSSASFLGYPTEPAINTSLQVFINDYFFDKNNNAISIRAEAEDQMRRKKQRGVWSGNWLLAELPGLAHTRYTRLSMSPLNFTIARVPGSSYMVLLEINTGKWTTELNSPWAATAPVKQLCDKLTGFYGSELQCPECCQPLAIRQKSDTTSSAQHGANNQTKS